MTTSKERVDLFTVLSLFLFLAGCNGDPGTSRTGVTENVELTHLPCDLASLVWMQPFGDVDHGGGNAFFHNGIDFGTQPNAAFYSCAAGRVTGVDLDTGVGAAGKNYRITIKVSDSLSLDYHFETYGEIPEPQRLANIFVSEGDTVAAGQLIANLIVTDTDLTHVHWIVFHDGNATECPLNFFSVSAAVAFEAMYDDPSVEKRPADRPDLCE